MRSRILRPYPPSTSEHPFLSQLIDTEVPYCDLLALTFLTPIFRLVDASGRTPPLAELLNPSPSSQFYLQVLYEHPPRLTSMWRRVKYGVGLWIEELGDHSEMWEENAVQRYYGDAVERLWGARSTGARQCAATDTKVSTQTLKALEAGFAEDLDDQVRGGKQSEWCTGCCKEVPEDGWAGEVQLGLRRLNGPWGGYGEATKGYIAREGFSSSEYEPAQEGGKDVVSSWGGRMTEEKGGKAEDGSQEDRYWERDYAARKRCRARGNKREVVKGLCCFDALRVMEIERVLREERSKWWWQRSDPIPKELAKWGSWNWPMRRSHYIDFTLRTTIALCLDTRLLYLSDENRKLRPKHGIPEW